MERRGSIIAIGEEEIGKYKDYHKNVWQEVLEMIKNCHINNYSIYYKDGYLFSYFEYTGDDYESDMNRMAADPKTQEWWRIMKPLMKPLHNCKEGEFWTEMEEVFHLE